MTAPALTLLGCHRCGRPTNDPCHVWLPEYDGRASDAHHAFDPPRCRSCGRAISIFNLTRLCGGLRPCAGGDAIVLED